MIELLPHLRKQLICNISKVIKKGYCIVIFVHYDTHHNKQTKVVPLHILSLMAGQTFQTANQACRRTQQPGPSFSYFLLYLDFPYVHSLRSSRSSMQCVQKILLRRNGTRLCTMAGFMNLPQKTIANLQYDTGPVLQVWNQDSEKFKSLLLL